MTICGWSTPPGVLHVPMVAVMGSVTLTEPVGASATSVPTGVASTSASDISAPPPTVVARSASSRNCPSSTAASRKPTLAAKSRSVAVTSASMRNEPIWTNPASEAVAPRLRSTPTVTSNPKATVTPSWAAASRAMPASRISVPSSRSSSCAWPPS